MSEEEISKHVNQLKWYPIVLIITIVPIIIYRVIEIYYKKRIFWLALITILIESSRSILFLVCFAVNNNVRRILRSIFRVRQRDSFEMRHTRNKNRNSDFDNTVVSGTNLNESSFISNYDDDNFEFGRRTKFNNSNDY